MDIARRELCLSSYGAFYPRDSDLFTKREKDSQYVSIGIGREVAPHHLRISSTAFSLGDRDFVYCLMFVDSSPLGPHPMPRILDVDS